MGLGRQIDSKFIWVRLAVLSKERLLDHEPQIVDPARAMPSLNPYKSPGTIQSRVDSPKPRRSGLLACIAIVFAFLMAISILVTQRNFAKIFVEFDIQIPLATLFACSPILPLVLLAITIIAIALSVLGDYHRFADRWNGMLMVFSIIVLATYVWGIFSPLMQLISGLSK